MAVVVQHLWLKGDEVLVRPRLSTPRLGPSAVVTPVVHVDLSSLRPPALGADQQARIIEAVLRARVLSFGLILGLAFLLIVSLVISAGVAALGGWASGLWPAWEVTLQALNTLIAVGATTVLFAMIFKFMPSVPLQWHDVWVGAAVTAVLFELGKFAIGYYLGKSGVNETYAAAGSLVVVLAWVYYAAQIFLLGAEFTKVYADERGSAVGKRAVAATQTGALVAAAGSDITADMLPATPAGAALPAAHSDVLQAQVQMLEQRTGQQRAQLDLFFRGQGIAIALLGHQRLSPLGVDLHYQT